ncbi:hypothetical protein E6C60_2590 [Paenibacillus algicola]|uniref:Uncharacterized protein n=1 Tax=Paenibacillus algicola TaxID=2565926 RepID=A0A4P8XKP7_9BACL|nr:hypothetical protein E6C60_2590 [Paenibacillus algicola]
MKPRRVRRKEERELNIKLTIAVVTLINSILTTIILLTK